MTEQGNGTGPRPRRRAVWIALAALTALAVIVPCGITAAGAVLNRSTTTSAVLPGPVREVRVDVGEADVRLERGEPDRTRISERLSWAIRRPTVRKYVKDGVLWIQVRCDGASEAFIDLECGAELDVAVPAGTRVTAISTSGSLEVEGLGGGVELRTRSGALDLTDVRGEVLFEANSGALRARRLDAPKLTSKVGSGSVDVEFARPPGQVTARSGSGAVDMGFPEGSHYRVGGDSGSGSWDVDPELQDRSATGRIDVSTGAGSVTLRYNRR